MGKPRTERRGLQYTDAFYWDMNDDTRAWTKRFVEKINGKQYPTMNHAGNYSGMLHYLKAMEAARAPLLALDKDHDGQLSVAERIPAIAFILQGAFIKKMGAIGFD